MEIINNFNKIFFDTISTYTLKSLQPTPLLRSLSEDNYESHLIKLPTSELSNSIIEIEDLLIKLNGGKDGAKL